MARDRTRPRTQPPPASTPTRRATFEEWLATSNDGRRWEIIDGVLIASPVPKARHGVVAQRLAQALGRFDDGGGDGPGGWVLVSPAGIRMPNGDLFAPDLAGWRAERFPRHGYDHHAIDVMPDWICEIASPSAEADDKVRKLPAYLAAGVPFAWIVDPIRRFLQILEADQERDAWMLAANLTSEPEARARAFDAAPINIPRLWPPRPEES